MSGRLVLTLDCEDRVGIVAAVSGFLAERGGFITESQQFADLDANRFFMRVAFSVGGPGRAAVRAFGPDFAAIAQRFAFTWSVVDSSRKMRAVIAVSRGSHCLNDLLHRWSAGAIAIDVAGVVSNHDSNRALAEWHGVPFHHLPVGDGNRIEQEKAIAGIMHDAGADLLVLARYMQVLSPGFVRTLAGRCVNIHHSFLPAFEGARPYARAHERGVKLIGATAHFVTTELDQGPIIEQAVERVDHRASVADLVRIGRDVEAQVLARAVGWVAERRVLINGARTVVFR